MMINIGLNLNAQRRRQVSAVLALSVASSVSCFIFFSNSYSFESSPVSEIPQDFGHCVDSSVFWPKPVTISVTVEGLNLLMLCKAFVSVSEYV